MALGRLGAQACESFAMELDKSARPDRFTNLPSQAMQIGQIVKRGQDRAQHLVGEKEVADVAAAKVATSRAIATLLDGSSVGAMGGVPHLDGAVGRQAGGVAAVAGR